MAAKNKTPLKTKVEALPKRISIRKDFIPQLVKAGISERTFYRDLRSPGSSIPHERLQVYAALLSCDIAELVDTYVKVKSVFAKRSRLKK